MRFALTVHRDPYRFVGGSEEVVRRLAEGLAERGHEITLLTALDGAEVREAVHGKVTVRRFDVPRIGRISLPPLAYRRALVEEDWDAVLFYGQNVWITNHAVGLLERMAARTVYAPVSFYNLKRAHLRNPLQRSWDRLYYGTVQPHLLRHADVVVAITEEEVQDIRKLAEPARLVHIPNGVAWDEHQNAPELDVHDRFDLPRDRPLLVHIGGDYPNKRLGLLADAVQQLHQVGQPVTVALLGTGTEPWSSRTGLHGLGRVIGEEKLALLHEANALVSTSDFEGFGLVLVEALACGTPFISTPVGVAPELARRQVGTLATAVSAPAVAEAIQQELATERDPKHLRTVAKEYDWDRIVERFEAEMMGLDDVDPA